MYMVVTLILPIARRHLPLIAAQASTLRVRYPDGHGILRQILNETTQWWPATARAPKSEAGP
jgi:hypothetical protein